MKYRFIILVLAGFLVSFKGFSQDGDKPLTVGAQAHLTHGYMTESFLSNSHELRRGYALGAFAEYRIIDLVSAGVGLQYHWTGSNGVPTDQLFYPSEAIIIEGLITNVDLSLGKLELPIYGRVHIGPFSAIAGVSYNWIYSPEIEITENLGGAEGTSTLDVTDRLVRDEMSIFVGAGYTIDTGFLKITPEVQWHNGTFEINNMLNKGSYFSNSIMVGAKVGVPLDLPFF